MVKKLMTLILGLTLTLSASAQLVTIDPSDVQFWTGSGSNSTVVAIGWDDNSASYTPTVVIWGVRWEGTIYLINALDTIAAYDERFSYTMGSSGFLQTLSYNDPDNGLVLTPSMEWNCNSYGSVYGSTVLTSTPLRISESTCDNYTFTGVNNIVYATDPNAAFSCAKAQALSLTDLTANTVTVNITDTTYVNNYTVMLYAGDSLVDSVVISTQTISYTTLSDNTAYTVKVFSNCSDGTQTASRSISFRTPCIAVAHTSLPWTEDFQSGTGSSYSTASAFFSNHVFCWDLINPYSSSDPYINSSSSVNVSGGQCLYVSNRPSSPTILVLPPFEDTPDQLQLSFDVLSTYGHGFEAGVITDVTDISTFTPIATCLPTGSGWNHFEVTFAGITSGRIALRRNDNSYGYLDNVTVNELPSCVKPSQVIISNIDTYSADITITDPNATNHYMIYVAEDSMEIYSDNYTLTDLLPNMRYEVAVRTVCPDGLTNATVTAFRTGCGPIAVPYHEDFSQFVDVANGYGYAVTDSTLPCWSFFKARALDRLELFTPSQSSTYGYGNDGYTLRIYGNYSNSRDILVLPELNQGTNTLEVSFMARPSETGSFGGILEVGYMTDPTDTASFVTVSSNPCGQFTNGYDLRTATFTNAPMDARIALRVVLTGGSAKSWYIDELDVHDMPACARANGISVDNITTDGFTLHVDDPTSVNNYRYYITSEAGIDSLDFYDTVVTVTGLAASTDYELSVVSICDDGTLTLPHTISASTLCAPVTTVPFEEDFESWTASQSQGMNRCWNRLYCNSSNNLVNNNYPYCASGSSYALNGIKSLKMYSKGTSSGIKEYSVAYLPEFEANVTGLKVRFFYKYGGTTTNINKVRIAVGISENVTDTTTFTRLATLTPSVIGWNEFEVDFSAYTGTGNRITIMQTSIGTTAITSYIDSLVVDTISSCNRPATFEVSDITAHGATLTWTDPSNADSYIIHWSDGASTDSVTVTGETSYELTELAPSSNYTVDIRSICWGEPTNARTLSFATSCAPMPLPWSMNFNNISNLNQLSSCWNRYSGLYIDSTHSATLTSTTSGWTRSTTAFEGSSHVKVNLYGSSCKYWLVTPEIDLTEAAELTFDYMLTKYNVTDAPETGTGLEDDRFIVLATTDNGTSWNPVAQWGNDTINRDDYYLPAVNNTSSHATISLSDFTGQTVRLAFYGESTVGGTDNDFHLDNIAVIVATDTMVTPIDTTEIPVEPIELCTTIYPLTYSEDFASYTTNQDIRPYFASAPIPDCWTVIGNGTVQHSGNGTSTNSDYFGGVGYSTSTNNFGAIASNDAFFAFIASQIYTGTNTEHINNMLSTGTRRYAVLPAFDAPLSQTILTFDHRTNIADANAQLSVGYILTDTADFVALETYTADNKVLHHDTIHFNQHTNIPDNARLTLMWNVASSTACSTGPGNRYCGIDNLIVALESTTPIDTVIPEPTPEDASIAASDILFWVGEGANEVVMAVNWADPDTCLAWGVMWNGSATVKDLMDSIMAHDSRFTYTENNGMLGDIIYTVDGLTLQLTEESASPWGNYWLYNVNGTAAQDMFNAHEVHNGDFVKWGDPNSGTSIGTDEWGMDILVWTTTVTPVTVNTTGISEINMTIESIWPNPTIAIVNVCVNREAKAEIHDLSGRRLGTYTLSEGSNTIDLSNFTAGVYLLCIENSISKIVKR